MFGNGCGMPQKKTSEFSWGKYSLYVLVPGRILENPPYMVPYGLML